VDKRYVPLMKTVVGEWVEDPILAQLPVEFKNNFKMRIPIWYASVPVRDVGKKDCYASSILIGADYALKISGKLSGFIKPDKFYVSFPHTVYSPWKLQRFRKRIKSSKNNFYFTLEGKSIRDGVPIGFTFFREELPQFKKNLDSLVIGEWKYTGISSEQIDLKLLKRRNPSERVSNKDIRLDEVFSCATLEGATILPGYRIHDISTWDGYVKYISSNYHYKMQRKIKYFRYNKIKDLEERLIDCGVFDDYDRITGDLQPED